MLGQRTGKTNNLKVFRKNKTKGINSIAKIMLLSGHCGCDHMVVGFTTTYAISAYDH
jgi:hypothetical protein